MVTTRVNGPFPYINPRYFPALLVCILLQCGGPGTDSAPRAEKGVLDLRSHNLKGQTVQLAGDWEFYGGRLLAPGQFSDVSPIAAQVPGFWNELESNGSPMGSHGFATYRLVVLLPEALRGRTLDLKLSTASSALRLFANGRIVFEAGKVGKSPETHTPDYRTGIASIRAGNANNSIELIAQVSNFEDRNGGLWKPIHLGTETAIKSMEMRGLTLDLILIGALLIMGLYHLSLFGARREDHASLLFGLFCLLITLRITLRSQFVFGRFLPDFPWGPTHQGSYLTYYLAVPLFCHFLLTAFADPRRRMLARLVWPIPILFSMVVVFTPVTFYTSFLKYYHVFAALGLAMAVTLWVRAVINQRKGALVSAGAGLLLVGALINDVLYAERVIQSVELSAAALFIFMLSQSYVLAATFSAAFEAVARLMPRLEKKSRELQETNEALARFVPSAFLRQLGKEDIREIDLGDQIETEMGILFADMHSFAELSEQLSPDENFRFLNSYLERIAPVVGEHRGFIDKYIGNTIMALFPEGPMDPLEAAIAMQERIRIYNQLRERTGYAPIRIGVGLHSGRLMLGTIGARERMDGTVISDAVNTAARIEALTRVYDSYILMSETVFKGLTNTRDYLVRMVDSVVVKGKKARVSVFEVFNGAPPDRIELFHETRADFERGIFAYSSGDMVACGEAMSRVLARNPADKAAQIYMERTRKARGRAS